jgi:A/G-specific adenine glycosylase
MRRVPDKKRTNAIVGAVGRWYKRKGRVLQWRSTTDPYEILISEIMLQQTQVDRVKVKLPIFLKTFPTWRKLARASRADVLRAWQGMGYNNRAVRLRDLARIIDSTFSGTLPDDPEILIELPGIGPYTAHAVASFAFRKRVPVVDVNIQRVFTRVFHRTSSTKYSIPPKAAWEIAHEILPRDPYIWNQALMDLGATICTARSPKCPLCPLNKLCASANKFITKSTPVSIPKERKEKGAPRRIWRGRVVETLRRSRRGDAISLARIGKKIKADFSTQELKWIAGLVEDLRRDGIVQTRSANGVTRVMLAQD